MPGHCHQPSPQEPSHYFIPSREALPLRISHPPINLPQIHTIHLPLRNLPNHPRRASRHNTKTRNHHIGRHNTAIQDPYIVLDDRKLADHDACPDVDVRADERCFDDGGGAHEDVVCDFEGVVGELSADSNTAISHQFSPS
jgi:hypothetical protein